MSAHRSARRSPRTALTSLSTTGATATRPSSAGQPVGGFVAVGGTGYEVARVELDNSGNGNHEVSGSEAFGITVYGYGDYTSYWYPGGSDLNIIPQ